MRSERSSLVFVGIKSSVMALDAQSGAEVWRTNLRSSDYVGVLFDGTALFASNSGEVWRLDPDTGAEIWHNDMRGLGRGIVSLASSHKGTASADTSLSAEKRRRNAASTAAATAG